MRVPSPDDGTVSRLLVKPGTAIEPGQNFVELDDTVRPFEVPLGALQPEGEGRLLRWRVEPGQLIQPGDSLADLEFGGATMLLKSADTGTVARFEAASGETVKPDQALMFTQIHGFDKKANGLPGVWFGIALMMIGSMVVALLLPLSDLERSGWAGRLGEIVRLRRFWILVVVSVSINVCWHFLVSWLPTYLQTDRKMSYLAGGLLSALPFLMADAGNLGGGALSRWLASRGVEPTRARLRVMTVCAVLVSCGAWVGGIRSDAVTIVLLGLMALGAAAYMANYFSFCQEVSGRHTGLIVGYLGGLGNLLAAGFNPIAGRVKDQVGSFGPVFVMVGLVPFLGLALLSLAWGLPKAERPSEPPLGD